MSAPRNAVLAALAAAAVLTSCSSGDDTGQKTRGTGEKGGVAAVGGQPLADAHLAFARCMRRQGIDFPDPGPGKGFELGRGQDETRVRAAERRCDRYRRAIADATPKPSARRLQQDRDATLRFARCMRRHGANVPDPRLTEGGTSVAVPSDAKTDADFQRASRACERTMRGAGSGE